MRMGTPRAAGARVWAAAVVCVAMIAGAGCKGKYETEVREFATEVCVRTARTQIGMKPSLLMTMSLLETLPQSMKTAGGITGSEIDVSAYEALAAEWKELKTLPLYGPKADEEVAAILRTTGLAAPERDAKIAAALGETDWWKNGCAKELPAIYQKCAVEHGFKTPAFLTCLDPDELTSTMAKWSPFLSRYERELKPRLTAMGLFPELTGQGEKRR